MRHNCFELNQDSFVDSRCHQPTSFVVPVVAASNSASGHDTAHGEALGYDAVNDTLGSLCDRMENLVVKDDTLMSSTLASPRAAIRSPAWPASPGESPVQGSRDVSGTPPPAIGCKIPPLRPSPGSLVTGTPPSAKRSPNRRGRRNQPRVSRPLSTRTDATAAILTQTVSVDVGSTPPRSAKKSKQRRYR